MEYDVVLRLVCVMNLKLILCWSFTIQGREPYLNINLNGDIYRPISFKLGVMIEIAKLYILRLVWMTLTFVQCHNCMRNKNNVGVYFLTN